MRCSERRGHIPVDNPTPRLAIAELGALNRRKNNVTMTSRQALAYIRKHGVVLEAATGPVPSIAEVIAGEPVRGSWWSHPKSHEIFAVTRAIRDSDEVLVCRLIKGKVTFVHRRLWPALVRASGEPVSIRSPFAGARGTHEVGTSRHQRSPVP